jgi:hypothetical protein
VDESDSEHENVAAQPTQQQQQPKKLQGKSKSFMALSDGEKLRELQEKYNNLKQLCDEGVALQEELKTKCDSREAASKELIEQLRNDNARLKKQLELKSTQSVASEQVLRIADDNARLTARCDEMLRTMALFETMTSITVESTAPNAFRCRCANARPGDSRALVFDLIMNADDEVEYVPIEIKTPNLSPFMREAICFGSHDFPLLLSNLLSVVHKQNKSTEQNEQ